MKKKVIIIAIISGLLILAAMAIMLMAAITMALSDEAGFYGSKDVSSEYSYDGAQQAVDWAVKIANDDSFTYGQGKPAHNYGCYFCGNQGKKQAQAKKLGINKSYKKTYCCNPFVTAAYVHGAKDPYLSCSKCINLLTSAKKNCGKGRYKNFEWLGHIPESELLPGDVILSKTHAKMYVGDGKQVEAAKEGWGADTIRVCKLTYGSKWEVMRYIGGGGGGVYTWPVPSCYTITSKFGWRYCPFHGNEYHPAIDIGAPYGSKVVAAQSGTVISAGWNGGYGKQVVIDHGGGMTTYYSHLSAFECSKGDRVKKGQIIARVGSTGSSTGPHLDFKVYKNGTPQDPNNYVKKK